MMEETAAAALIIAVVKRNENEPQNARKNKMG